jgi:hypothetical protein
MTLSIFQWLVLFGLLLIIAALAECRSLLRQINYNVGETNEHLEELKTAVSSIDDKLEQEADPETGTVI